MIKLFTLFFRQHFNFKVNSVSLLSLMILLLTTFPLLLSAQQTRRVYANSQTNSVEAKGTVQILSSQGNGINLASALQTLGIDLADLGRVRNAGNASDLNPQTRSTLEGTFLQANISLNILIGTINIARVEVGALVTQTLKFPSIATGSMPLTVKLGTSGNLATTLLDGVSLQAMNGNTPVGPVIRSTPELLNVLTGSSAGEITFIPGVPYDGVRVSLSSESLLTLNAFMGIDVYHAYYLENTATIANCDAPNDILFGSSASVAALASVTDPWNAIDNNTSTYASLRSGVNVVADPLQGVHVKANFPSLSVAGDSVKVMVSYPGALLQADLLKSFTIQTINRADNGFETVVETISSNSALLRLEVLSGSTDRATISFKTSQPFNRVKVYYAGVATVLESVRVYEISRNATLPVVTAPGIDVSTNTLTVCAGAPVNITINNPEANSTYRYYTAAVGGTPITAGVSANGTVFSPAGLTVGMHDFYVAIARNGCNNDASARTKFSINVLAAPLASDIVVAGNATPYCAGSVVTLTATLASPTSTPIVNPVYRFYKNADKTGAITDGMVEGAISYTVNNGVLAVNGLTASTTYYVSVESGTGVACSNPVGQLKDIPVTVNSVPTDDSILSSPSYSQCMGQPVVINPGVVGTIVNPRIRYYLDANKASEILSGYTNGQGEVFTIAGNQLTITNTQNGTNTYYITVSGDNFCENATGKAFQVVVDANLAPPTFVNSTVNVCGAGGTATFVISNYQTGFTYTVFTDPALSIPAAGNVSVNNDIVSVTNVNANAVYYLVAQNPGGCSSLTSGQINIAYQPRSLAGAISSFEGNGGTTGNICATADGKILLTATSTYTSPTYYFYEGGILLGSNTTGVWEVSAFTPGNPITFSVGVSGDGNCETDVADRRSITITPNLIPDVPVITSLVNVIRAGGTFTLTVSPAPANASTYKWYKDNVLLAETSATLTITNATTADEGNYTVEAVGVSGCTSLASAAINIKVESFVFWKSAAVQGGTPDVRGGETVTYTIHIRNNGVSVLNNMSIVDALPQYTQFVSATDAGVLNGNNVEFSGINVAAGQTVTRSFTVTVNNNLTGADIIRNIAFLNGSSESNVPSIPADANDPNQPGDMTKTGTDIPVVKVFTNAFWKSAAVSGGANAVRGGEEVTYTIYIRNTGNRDLSNIVIRDPMPANTTFVSATDGGAMAGTEITFPVQNIAFGQTKTLTFTVRVNDNLTGVNTITNIAYLNDNITAEKGSIPPDPANPAEPGDPTLTGTDIPVTALETFTAWKSYAINGGGSSVKGGEDVTYTIHIRNTGNRDIANVVVRDPLPANTQFVSATNGGSLVGGDVTFPALTIPYGQTSTVTFTVNVNNNLTGVSTIRNIAYVSQGANPEMPSLPPNPTDPNQPGDPALTGTDIPVSAVETFVSWKAFNVAGGASSVRGGEHITYTLYVRNMGNKDLTNVVVRDPLPAHTEFVSAMNNGTLTGGNITFPVMNIAYGQTASVSFTVKVNNNLNGVTAIRNIAYVSQGGNPEIPSIPPNAGDPTQPGDPTLTGTDIPVTPVETFVAWKSYSVSGGATSVSGGEHITYTVHVRNTGNKNLTGIQVRDPLPNNTTFVSASNAGVMSGTDVTFSGIDIPYGETYTVSFIVKVDANLTGVSTIRNVAYVKNGNDPEMPSIPPDPTNPTEPGDPTLTGTDIPVTPVNSQISWKSFSINTGAGNVKGGEEVTYTIHVRNTGNADLSAVVVRDPIPAHTDFLSVGNGGTLVGNEVVFAPFAVPFGQTVTRTFVVKVQGNLTGVSSIGNIAYVNDGTNPETPTLPPSTGDPNEPGDPGTPGTNIPVVQAPDFTIVLSATSTHASGKASAGDVLTYNIVVTNTGNTALQDIDLWGDIPTGTVNAISPTGVQANNKMNFKLSSLPYGTSQSVQYSVTVGNDLRNIPVISNTIEGTALGIQRTSNRIDIETECIAPSSVVNASLASPVICAGGTSVITINNPEAGIIYRFYTQATGGTAVAEGTTFTTPALNATTVYYIETVRAAGLCSSNSRAQVRIEVLPVLVPPVVTKQASTPTSITFAWQAVNGAASYEYSLNNGGTWMVPTAGASATSQTISGLAPNEAVTIVVRALGTQSCQTSALSAAFTDRADNPMGNDVYIPNAFTPNGDGRNDVFDIQGVTLASYVLEIYNQFGQLVYKSAPGKNGWDGRMKGVLQPSGVYVYRAVITSQDGTVAIRRGTVTLIR